MLCLSRKANEAIVIGRGDQRVEVLVLSVRQGRVRLGITAPREIPVHRREIAEIIEGENGDSIS